MSVILSCGHREDDFDRHCYAMTKDWTREHSKAVGYRTICLSCYKAYEKSGLLLYTDKEAMEWLHE